MEDNTNNQERSTILFSQQEANLKEVIHNDVDGEGEGNYDPDANADNQQLEYSDNYLTVPGTTIDPKWPYLKKMLYGSLRNSHQPGIDFKDWMDGALYLLATRTQSNDNSGLTSDNQKTGEDRNEKNNNIYEINRQDWAVFTATEFILWMRGGCKPTEPDIFKNSSTVSNSCKDNSRLIPQGELNDKKMTDLRGFFDAYRYFDHHINSNKDYLQNKTKWRFPWPGKYKPFVNDSSLLYARQFDTLLNLSLIILKNSQFITLNRIHDTTMEFLSLLKSEIKPNPTSYQDLRAKLYEKSYFQQLDSSQQNQAFAELAALLFMAHWVFLIENEHIADHEDRFVLAQIPERLLKGEPQMKVTRILSEFLRNQRTEVPEIPSQAVLLLTSLVKTIFLLDRRKVMKTNSKKERPRSYQAWFDDITKFFVPIYLPSYLKSTSQASAYTIKNIQNKYSNFFALKGTSDTGLKINYDGLHNRILPFIYHYSDPNQRYLGAFGASISWQSDDDRNSDRKLNEIGSLALNLINDIRDEFRDDFIEEELPTYIFTMLERIELADVEELTNKVLYTAVERSFLPPDEDEINRLYKNLSESELTAAEQVLEEALIRAIKKLNQSVVGIKPHLRQL